MNNFIFKLNKMRSGILLSFLILVSITSIIFISASNCPIGVIYCNPNIPFLNPEQTVTTTSSTNCTCTANVTNAWTTDTDQTGLTGNKTGNYTLNTRGDIHLDDFVLGGGNLYGDNFFFLNTGIGGAVGLQTQSIHNYDGSIMFADLTNYLILDSTESNSIGWNDRILYGRWRAGSPAGIGQFDVYTKDNGFGNTTNDKGLFVLDTTNQVGVWGRSDGFDGIQINNQGNFTDWWHMYLNYYSTGNVHIGQGGGGAYIGTAGSVPVTMGSNKLIVNGNARIIGNLTASNICYSNGTNCNTNFTTYYPNITSTTGGTNTTDNITLMWYYDLATYNITEGAGADPLTLYINYTNVSSFSQWVVREYYDGAHTIQFELYEYPTGLWQSYYSISAQSGFNVISVPVFDPNDHLQNGIVQTRLRHIDNGIPTHNLYVDFAWLLNGNNIGASPDLTGFARYNFGFNNFNGTGNFTTTGSIKPNSIRMNEISGACDLTINHSICSNASGTFIVG